MKKSVICLLIILMVIFIFGSLVAAQVPSPRPGGIGFRPSAPPPALPALPGLMEAPTWQGCRYVPSKLVLTLEELAALESMNRGQCVPVRFVLPIFMCGQELIWTSKDPGVAKLRVPPGEPPLNIEDRNSCRWDGAPGPFESVTTAPEGATYRSLIHDACICPIGRGETIISVTTTNGSFYYEFIITVK